MPSRQSYIAATPDTLPPGVKIVPNKNKGGIAEGVRGFVAHAGIGSGENQITFRLPESEKSELEKMAEQYGVSRAEVIRCLISLGKEAIESLPELLKK